MGPCDRLGKLWRPFQKNAPRTQTISTPCKTTKETNYGERQLYAWASSLAPGEGDLEVSGMWRDTSQIRRKVFSEVVLSIWGFLSKGGWVGGSALR